ncbi:MAG: 2-C-methyl-D-erythritol 4-phosphate cytidylyltransferase [Leptonema illini]|uniref:2-C-methyl-D-erythritol 4-phosphate cytidylyltransferase n=1 Tax=Leptonema illini TaxID=183 RepID=A0A833H5J7_9LEPT|nr:MAG: 2-C-methyl-D-erythritol 4-phosphate cytidylyltransferase [Leptonema illini]
MNRLSVSVILLAGGTGRRFGADRPKQFVPLADQPMLAWSLRRFCSWLDRIESADASFKAGSLVLVSHPDYSTESLDLASRTVPEWAGKLILAEGGATRHLSSVNGVRAAGQSGIYVIHDTARPYVPDSDLDALLDAFRDSESSVASLVVPSSETLVQGSEGLLEKGLDRNHIFAVKTPQAFRSSLHERFVQETDRPEYTDLLRWAEIQGERATLVAGSALNLKLTNPEDRLILEAVLRNAALMKGRAGEHGV